MEIYVLNTSQFEDKACVNVNKKLCYLSESNAAFFGEDGSDCAKVSVSSEKLRYPAWQINFVATLGTCLGSPWRQKSLQKYDLIKSKFMEIFEDTYVSDYQKDLSKKGIFVSLVPNYFGQEKPVVSFQDKGSDSTLGRQAEQLTELADYMCRNSPEFRREYEIMLRTFCANGSDDILALKYQGKPLEIQQTYEVDKSNAEHPRLTLITKSDKNLALGYHRQKQYEL